MKKLYYILKIFLWGSVGVFIGNCIYKFYDYKTYPNLYEAQSAPWYLGIEIQGFYTAVIIVATLTAMWFVRKKMK